MYIEHPYFYEGKYYAKQRFLVQSVMLRKSTDRSQLAGW